jgi:hypothetical protein
MEHDANPNAQRSYGGLDTDFWARRPLIGMVHLPPLPGSPRWNGAARHDERRSGSGHA